MSERSPTRKRRTIGANNPLDKLGDDPLGFIPGTPSNSERPTSPEPPQVTPRAEPNPAQLKQISVRIPPDLYRRLKVSVARSGQSQRDYLIEVIRERLDADGS